MEFITSLELFLQLITHYLNVL